MPYLPISDEDRAWALQNDAEERTVGPCGPVIVWVNNVVIWIQEQSGLQKIAMILGILCLLGLINGFIEDEHISILVPSDGICAEKAS
jgi:hypothetical protein